MNYMELLDVNNGISDDVITAAEKEMQISVLMVEIWPMHLIFLLGK